MLRNVLLAGLVSSVIAVTAFSQTTKGTITADETWAGNVTITGDLVVTTGTLTIQPGTVVKFAATQSNSDIIYGRDNKIVLAVALNGAIQAVGTASLPIKFTTANIITPAAGNWGTIKLIGNGTRSRFSYCIVEYSNDGFNLENTSGVTAASSPVIDHCIVRNVYYSGIFAANGSNVAVDHCVFHDCGSAAIFYDGAATTPITNTYIYNVGTGIILSGRTSAAANVTISHCTIYNVDMTLDLAPQWWTGSGIFCTNTPSTLTMNNTIINKVTLNGLTVNSWTVTSVNNCWYECLAAVSGGSVGTSAQEVDPMLADPTNGDLRLDAGSPCLNTATDSTNRGAWQSAATWPVFGTSIGIADKAAGQAASLRLSTYPNPVVAGVRISLDGAQGRVQASIFDLRGQLVNTLSGNRELVWDRSDRAGRTVAAGLYFVRAMVNGQAVSQTVMVK